MKSLLIALLGVAVLAAPAAETFAQGSSSTGSSPAAPSTTAPSGTGGGSATGSASGTTTSSGDRGAVSSGSSSTTAPSGSAGGSASGSVSTDSRDDGASALPRSSVRERTTIFGLSPTAAVLIAAALLLVVAPRQQGQAGPVALLRGDEGIERLCRLLAAAQHVPEPSFTLSRAMRTPFHSRGRAARTSRTVARMSSERATGSPSCFQSCP